MAFYVYEVYRDQYKNRLYKTFETSEEAEDCKRMLETEHENLVLIVESDTAVGTIEALDAFRRKHGLGVRS